MTTTEEMEKNILLKSEILTLRDACDGCLILEKYIASLELDSIVNGHVISESINRENTSLESMVKHCHTVCPDWDPDYKLHKEKKENDKIGFEWIVRIVCAIFTIVVFGIVIIA